MEATVNLVLGLISLGGFLYIVNKIKSLFFEAKITKEDAQVLDLTKRIADQKIVIDGKTKTAQELLNEYKRQAEEFNKFDSTDDPNKPAS